MKLNLYPKVIPKDTPPPPLTKGGVVVGMTMVASTPAAWAA